MPASSIPRSPFPTALTELASGIDALYLSGRADPPAELLARLEVAQLTAKELDEPVEVEVAGVQFLLNPYSWGKYPFSLEHGLGRIGLRPNGKLPAVRVQPRADALHGMGPKQVIQFFDLIVTEAVSPVVWSVNRLDLFIDVQGWELSPSMADRFVARPKLLTTHMNGELCTGFQFGTRRTKAFSARLYDKTVDIHNTGSTWMRDAWGDAYDPSLPVHRMEFELGRRAIKQFQISDPDQVLEAVPDIWRYCTENWLRLCTPTGDDTKSRWPTDPTWLIVQAASLRQKELGLARVQARKGEADLARLVPALVGYLVTFAVLVRAASLADTLAALPDHIAAYEKRSGQSFADRVAKRRREQGFR
jgi:hypothetical protein